MATLAGNEHQMFSELCDRYGFVPATAIASECFTSLVKKLNDLCYAYIFVHDERSEGGELLVSVWVAPPHTPDEQLDRPDVGYKIEIAGGWDVDDGFFQQCERRITQLLPALRALSDAVAHELSLQKDQSERWSAHQRERDAFMSLKQFANNREGSACATALDVARELAIGNTSWSALKKACVAAADSLLEHDVLPEDAVEFYENDASFLGSSLTSQTYLNALGALSFSFSLIASYFSLSSYSIVVSSNSAPFLRVL